MQPRNCKLAPSGISLVTSQSLPDDFSPTRPSQFVRFIGGKRPHLLSTRLREDAIVFRVGRVIGVQLPLSANGHKVNFDLVGVLIVKDGEGLVVGFLL